MTRRTKRLCSRSCEIAREGELSPSMSAQDQRLSLGDQSAGLATDHSACWRCIRLYPGRLGPLRRHCIEQAQSESYSLNVLRGTHDRSEDRQRTCHTDPHQPEQHREGVYRAFHSRSKCRYAKAFARRYTASAVHHGGLLQRQWHDSVSAAFLLLRHA